MDIGEFIRAARERAGFTQSELARRAGTAQSAIARIEQGHTQPSLDTARRIVAAAGFNLGISLTPREEPRDRVVDAYKGGIDRTLLRENLAKTVDRRLRDMEAFRKSAAELRVAVQHRSGRPRR
jgi:transcriptional regulator with XRE-family HTH domain